jgi:NhaP-type Na+/H+ or K+/H+ antiporter
LAAPHAPLASPSLTIAVALGVGMLAQALARHLRIPGIVLLLACGVLLGPDVLGVVRPDNLGPALPALVGFAVAVILFEGGMNLDLRRLRRQARSIRQMVTIGALVTAAGGAVAARLLLEWDWRRAVLFGTLVMVTGPTVIQPLLRRIRVKSRVATVLEAEGVLVDAIGAVLAVVALEVAISQPTGVGVAFGAGDVAARLGFGLVFGLAGGVGIALLLRLRRVVPEGMENVLTLALAVLIFQAANVILPESGIAAVTFAGFAVGNLRSRVVEDLREFKEQLTVMLIALLFVLLAADVRLAEVQALGWAGFWTVIVLMIVVRPLNVIVGTWGSDLSWRERAFLSWLAPRGIVAAAIASLFASTLDVAGIEGGRELRALVFLVIAITVAVQGLTGGLVASLLGVRRRSGSGYVILGANDLGRAVARLLGAGGHEVVLIDSSPDAAQSAQAEKLRVLHGSALEDRVLLRADVEGRIGCLAVTANDETNLLFAKKAREEYRVPRAWVALRRGHLSVNPEMVHELGAQVLFGEPRSIELWNLRLERGLATIERWKRVEPGRADLEPELKAATAARRGAAPGDAELLVLPLVVLRNGKTLVVDDAMRFRQDDELYAVVFAEQRSRAHAWLAERGWELLEERAEPPVPSGSTMTGAGVG